MLDIYLAVSFQKTAIWLLTLIPVETDCLVGG